MVEKIEFVSFKWIILWLCIGLILRLLSIYYYVPLFNQDELSNLYDAISIAETGEDRFNTPSCFVIRGFGEADYRPPLYIWMEALLYGLFKMDEYGARFISLFFGMLAIAFSYLIVRRLVNAYLAGIVLLTLSLSPWHIIFSSIAFESATFSACIFLIALYTFVLYDSKKKIGYILLSSFMTGLSVNTYQSYKLTAFIFAVSILFYLVKLRKFRWILPTSILALIGAMPQVFLLFSHPEFFFARMNATANSIHNWYEYIWLFPAQFFQAFNPSLLFFELDKNYNLTNIRYLAIQFPLFIYGMINFYSTKEISKVKKWWILLVYILSALPEILTLSTPNLYRNNLQVYFIGFIIALGYYSLVRKYSKIQLGVMVLLFINFGVYTYIGYKKTSRHDHFQNNLVSLYTRLSIHEKKFSKIYLPDAGNQSYIYLLYYTRIAPRNFQTMEKEIESGKAKWDKVRRIDKFHFTATERLKNIELTPSDLLISLEKRQSNDVLFDSVLTDRNQYYFYRHGASHN